MPEKKKYRAVTSYAPRGIRQGEVYDLAAGDVLIAAGVCRPLADEPKAEPKAKTTRKKK